jgi:sodium-coupled monocarboxylate transporter 8/12
LSQLSALDVGVFAFYMLLLFGVGVWFTRRQKGLKTYLLADQNVHWVVVGISIMAALFSGISYLGAPAEAFFYDLAYFWTVISFLIATPVTTLVFLPFFRGLKLYTAYEYLEKRFDRRMRWVASSLFLVRVSFYVGLAIYAPALAIMEITGWPFWISVLLTGIAATLYTTLGGMQAVIWTDTLQFIVLCGGIVIILGFAIAAVPGGLPSILHLAAADGKTRFLYLDMDPTVRLSIWAALLGGTSHNLVMMVTDQISVQRYLTAPSLKDSQKALWLKLWVTFPLVSLFYLTGTVLYGYYKAFPSNVPPLAQAHLVPGLAVSSQIETVHRIANDRLLPYFVLHELPSPLPGLLIAGIFGATMALVSAAINSLATAALMDFRRTLLGDSKASDARSLVWARSLTVGFGVLGTVLALFVMEHLGTLVQAVNTGFGLFGGPLLGIFCLGVFSRRANTAGAFLGAAGGGIIGALVAFSGPLFGYSISFMWISFSSASMTFVLGSLASYLFPAPSESAKRLVYSWSHAFEE